MKARWILFLPLLLAAALPALAAPGTWGIGDLVLDGEKGIRVGLVEPGGPAAEAGVKPGDLIMGLEGKAASDPHRLMNQLKRVEAGRTVQIRILRDGKEQTLSVTPAARPQGEKPGLSGQAAPAWEVARWRNLPEGKAALDVADFKGKVLVLYCFQSWCPGCHKRGFPLLQKLVAHYQGREDVAFVAVQTVFEGFETNTPEKGWETAASFGLAIPVGHDGAAGKPSKLAAGYRVGGTPWFAVIDREGKVDSDGFCPTLEEAIRVIDRARAGTSPEKGEKEEAP
jgi:thiol-disulfide isomerase/thioredoxin